MELYVASPATSYRFLTNYDVRVGKGGSNWGPNTLNINNTKERGTSSKEPWDEAATSRLLNETIRILEETIGEKLPVP